MTVQPDEGFPARQPAALDPDDGALAVVGDLQLTPWLVRAVADREHNEREQAVLFADLRARLDDVAALVLVGDLVFSARSRRNWRHFDSLVAPLAARVPVLPVMGNHDYYCIFVELCTHAVVPRNVRLRFPWLAPGEPYGVAFGDVALIFLDTETALESQAAWLSESLAELEERFASVVVFMHRPAYTDTVEPDRTAQEAVREHLVPPIADASRPTLVVSGHEHGYEHLVVDGVHYVISAGGGGSRDPLRAERPHDVYGGANCSRDASGRVLRPFNYLLIRRDSAALRVTIRGLCERETQVRRIASFAVRLGR